MKKADTVVRVILIERVGEKTPQKIYIGISNKSLRDIPYEERITIGGIVKIALVDKRGSATKTEETGPSFSYYLCREWGAAGSFEFDKERTHSWTSITLAGKKSYVQDGRRIKSELTSFIKDTLRRIVKYPMYEIK